MNYIKMSPIVGVSGFGGGGSGLTLSAVKVWGPGAANELDWGGDRAVCSGGMLANESNTNEIQYITIYNEGNASEFGDLTNGRRG